MRQRPKKGIFPWRNLWYRFFPMCFLSWVPKARSTWSWCRSHGRVFGQGGPRRGGWGVKPGGWDMCSTDTSKKADSRTCNPLRSHPRTRYLWRRLHSCSPVEWFLKLTFWQKLWCWKTCLLFKVLLLSMFLCDTVFFWKYSISLDKNTKKSFPFACTGKEKAAESQEKCSFNGGVFLKKTPKESCIMTSSKHLTGWWEGEESSKEKERKNAESKSLNEFEESQQRKRQISGEFHHLRRMLINSRCERQNEWLIFRSQHKITQSEWALLSRVAVGRFRQNWSCQSTIHCCWVVLLGLLLTQFVALCAKWCFHHKKDMALHQNFFLTHGSRTC